jgi:hypothetical protein
MITRRTFLGALGVTPLGSLSGCIGAGGKSIDDFERDLAPYERIHGNARVSDDVAYQGEQSLRLNTAEQSPDGGPDAFVFSSSGLPTYPQRGDTFAYHMFCENIPDDGGVNFFFGAQGGSRERSYKIACDFWKDRMMIQKLTPSGGTILDERAVGHASQQWYNITTEWSDEVIEVSLQTTDETVTTLRARDSQYDTGGIGISAWTNPTTLTAYVDSLKITAGRSVFLDS